MIDHKEIYCAFFDIDYGDTIKCEAHEHDPKCVGFSQDIHHLSPRGMGGSKCKDYIENLVALSRACHEKAEHDKTFNKKVRVQHLKNIIKKLEE